MAGEGHPDPVISPFTVRRPVEGRLFDGGLPAAAVFRGVVTEAPRYLREAVALAAGLVVPGFVVPG